MKNQKGFVPIIGIIAVLVVAGVAGYFVLKQKKVESIRTEQKQQENVEKNEVSTKNEEVSENIYRNEKLNFQLTLPSGWEAKSWDSTNPVVTFYSSSDKVTLDNYEKECEAAECMGAYYSPGINFNAGSYDDVVIEERGAKTINNVNWRMRVYDGGGLGIVVYEAQIQGRYYTFWEFSLYDEETRKSQKFEQLLATFKPL